MNHWQPLKILFLCSLVSFSAAQDGKCLKFAYPLQGSTIVTPYCTLAVDASCSKVSKVEFQARYLANNSDSAIITTLGTITRPPFKLIWNIADIPNQLFSGAAFLAEATLSDGTIEEARCEGIFLAHQPITFPEITSPYDYSGTQRMTGDTILFESFRQALSMKASMYWNEKELTVLIDVADPLFYTSLKQNALLELGAEILLDPALNRKPYPDKDVLIFALPLSGKPYRIAYHAAFDSSGSFRLESSSAPCEYQHKVEKKDFKGYSIHFAIPRDLFGNKIPKAMGFNIVLKVLEQQNGEIRRVSWIHGSTYDAYSPHLWGKVEFSPKPYLKSRLLVWIIFFTFGFLVALGAIALAAALRKPRMLTNFERSEEDEQHFGNVRKAIENRITAKNLSSELIARELHLTQSKLNTLVKKHSGLSFQNFVMFYRIEIARERLRSSHSSEASIADQCGFSSVNEMERYFMKFHRTTPYKFRVEQQVA